jgi:hypothetical protein
MTNTRIAAFETMVTDFIGIVNNHKKEIETLSGKVLAMELGTYRNGNVVDADHNDKITDCNILRFNSGDLFDKQGIEVELRLYLTESTGYVTFMCDTPKELIYLRIRKQLLERLRSFIVEHGLSTLVNDYHCSYTGTTCTTEDIEGLRWVTDTDGTEFTDAIFKDGNISYPH